MKDPAPKVEIVEHVTQHLPLVSAQTCVHTTYIPLTHTHTSTTTKMPHFLEQGTSSSLPHACVYKAMAIAVLLDRASVQSIDSGEG